MARMALMHLKCDAFEVHFGLFKMHARSSVLQEELNKVFSQHVLKKFHDRFRAYFSVSVKLIQEVLSYHQN